MILYSITFSVENPVHEQWYNRLKNIQIPPLLLSGLIAEYKILRLLNEHDNGGTTYSCQFFMNDMTAVKKFEDQFEFPFLLEMDKNFKGQFAMFKTLLEVLI